MSTPHDVDLPLPPGWVVVPVDGEALETWAARTAAEVVGPDDEPQQQLLAHHLAVVAADCARREPLFAAALLGPGPGPVVLLLEGWSLLPDPGVPLELEALATQQRRAPSDAVLEPDVEVVHLPAGPAVRTRRILSGAPQESLQRSVVEELTHLVLPPGTPGEGLLLTASWQDVASGERYAALVDELVTELRVTV